MKLARAVAIAFMSVIMIATTATTAYAASDDVPGGSELRDSWDPTIISYIESDDDSGGYGLRIDLHNTSGGPYYTDYHAYFVPYGETLNLEDNWTDGRKAEADVRVTNSRGQVVDSDHFTTGTEDTFNLGTPDGSGNIPEGYGVDVRLCVGSYCTPWADGIA